MKKFFVFSLLLFIAMVPIKGFSVVDLGTYAGYTFKNVVYRGVHERPRFVKPTGWNWGLNAHFNMDFVPNVLNWGIGAYYQVAILSYKDPDRSGSHYLDFKRHTIGLDTYLSIEKIPVVAPFARFSIAIWENHKFDTFYFQSMTAGGGLDFKVFWKLRIYLEYAFNFTVEESDVTDNGHSVNVGVRLKF